MHSRQPFLGVLAWYVSRTSRLPVQGRRSDSDILLEGIPTCVVGNYGHRSTLLCKYLPFHLPGNFNSPIFQAAKAVSDSQDALVDLFERIESVFRRLETYIDVPLTAGMKDVIVKVMAEVLGILAIATKEIKQSNASELIPGDRSWLLGLSSLSSVFEEDCRESGYRGCANETREIGDRGSSNGGCRILEGYTRRWQ